MGIILSLPLSLHAAMSDDIRRKCLARRIDVGAAPAVADLYNELVVSHAILDSIGRILRQKIVSVEARKCALQVVFRVSVRLVPVDR